MISEVVYLHVAFVFETVLHKAADMIYWRTASSALDYYTAVVLRFSMETPNGRV